LISQDGVVPNLVTIELDLDLLPAVVQRLHYVDKNGLLRKLVQEVQGMQSPINNPGSRGIERHVIRMEGFCQGPREVLSVLVAQETYLERFVVSFTKSGLINRLVKHNDLWALVIIGIGDIIRKKVTVPSWQA
jgi:hypothetical protein